MRSNVGHLDRILRAFVVAPASVIGALAVGAGTIGGIVLLVVGAVMLATAVIGFCPLYALLGVNTCSRRTALQ